MSLLILLIISIKDSRLDGYRSRGETANSDAKQPPAMLF